MSRDISLVRTDGLQQLMQELSGEAPTANGQAPQRIEAGSGGYENGNGDDYGDGDRDLKPWQRGPTGAAAPWQRGDDRGGRDEYGSGDGGSAPPWAAAGRGDGYGYGQQSGGYGGAPPGPPGGTAPWSQQGPPPPPGPSAYGGYSGYPGGGYGDNYPAQPGMGAPPGLGGVSGGLGAPPGLGALFQHQYNGSGPPGGSPPPPPPPGDAPPPPVSTILRVVDCWETNHAAIASERHAATTTSSGRLSGYGHSFDSLSSMGPYSFLSLAGSVW